MSRKWIVAVTAAVAVALVAVAAGSVLGSGAAERPGMSTITVDLGDEQPANARRAPVKGSQKKPKLVYLQSTTPVAINPADVAAGGLGPSIDIKLTGCSKVIDGGVVPSRLDVYVQGTYVASPSEYHVIIGIDAKPNPDDRTPFTITSNLTCLKGAK